MTVHAMWQKTKEQAAWGPNFLRRSTATASRRVVMVIFGGLFCYGLGTAIPGAVSKYLVSRNRGDDAKRLKDGGDKAS
ncbi:hypothetical protein JKP88DRAFT_289427 [Tribonema minus]|uniref:Uncharacterized protein n=1 Tax=Tribonema minus TaxID=303371 RepID=A0A835Z2D5_9STRA|nr:hypothetical protein JKP88DRAFT_289427 [Tribonema minus]